MRVLIKRYPVGPLLRLDLYEYEAIFKKLAARAGVTSLSMFPHGQRHGGASFMALSMKKFDGQAIQSCGRWKAATSVMRYRKAGSYVRQLSRLSSSQRASARAMLASLEAKMIRAVAKLPGQRVANPPRPTRKR